MSRVTPELRAVMEREHRHAWGPRKGWGRIIALGIARKWPEVVQVCVLCGAEHPEVKP